MKKVFVIADGVASILNVYEIKGILNLLISISDGARFDKHGIGIGKTIRRRNSEKEAFYGKCKKIKNVFINAKAIREFDKFITIDDLNLKAMSLNFIKDSISFIEASTIKYPTVINEIKRKIEKLSKEIMGVEA